MLSNNVNVARLLLIYTNVHRYVGLNLIVTLKHVIFAIATAFALIRVHDGLEMQMNTKPTKSQLKREEMKMLRYRV